jgi:chorismate synthase
VTTGAPIALLIPNKDWENWQRTMAVEGAAGPDVAGVERPVVTRPRPGHADLAGVVKYGHEDIRNVLERASARETAARVAVGAVARQLLRAVGTEIASHVTGIGSASLGDPLAITFDDLLAIPADSPLHCVDPQVEQRMIAAIDAARDAGDTMGGSFEVIAHGVPAGLGSHVQWDRKLDGRLAQALMSIPAIKAVGIGRGPAVASLPGSRIHDEILPATGVVRSTGVGVVRPTNNAGGLEGGITNGEDLRVSAFMKPIATLMKPLRSVDLTTMEVSPAAVERSDVCAVPAAAVVGEAMVAIVLADAAIEKFGGDSVPELLENLQAFRARTAARFVPR